MWPLFLLVKFRKVNNEDNVSHLDAWKTNRTLIWWQHALRSSVSLEFTQLARRNSANVLEEPILYNVYGGATTFQVVRTGSIAFPTRVFQPPKFIIRLLQASLPAQGRYRIFPVIQSLFIPSHEILSGYYMGLHNTFKEAWAAKLATTIGPREQQQISTLPRTRKQESPRAAASQPDSLFHSPRKSINHQ